MEKALLEKGGVFGKIWLIKVADVIKLGKTYEITLNCY